MTHRLYGCETGCCGHVVEVDGEEVSGSFDFMHPDRGDERAYAEQAVRNAGCDPADLDWSECIVMADC